MWSRVAYQISADVCATVLDRPTREDGWAALGVAHDQHPFQVREFYHKAINNSVQFFK